MRCLLYGRIAMPTARGWPCTVVDEFEMESAITHMLHPSSPGSHTLLVASGAEFHGSDEPHETYTFNTPLESLEGKARFEEIVVK